MNYITFLTSILRTPGAAGPLNLQTPRGMFPDPRGMFRGMLRLRHGVMVDGYGEVGVERGGVGEGAG